MDRPGPAVPVDGGLSCSFCGQKGHRATKCPQNHHKKTLQNFLVRNGHSEETCWYKGKHNVACRVGVAATSVESGEELNLKKRQKKTLE